jgi:hypothetical protein
MHQSEAQSLVTLIPSSGRIGFILADEPTCMHTAILNDRRSKWTGLRPVDCWTTFAVASRVEPNVGADYPTLQLREFHAAILTSGPTRIGK